MKRISLILLCLGFFFTACENLNPGMTNNDRITFNKIPVKYPITHKDTSIHDNYHGQVISDPYRWLEDDNSESTKDWVKAQNHTTYSYLDQIPFRDAIEERLQKMWNYERFSTPFKKGEKYYFFKNNGLQNQSALYVQDEPGSESTLVLDPNHFSEEGTASLGTYAFSKSGRYLAYEVSEGGSDWRTIYVKDLKKRRTFKR